MPSRLRYEYVCKQPVSIMAFLQVYIPRRPSPHTRTLDIHAHCTQCGGVLRFHEVEQPELQPEDIPRLKRPRGATPGNWWIKFGWRREPPTFIEPDQDTPPNLGSTTRL